MSSPYVGGSYQGVADFIAIKNQQVHQYQDKADWYETRSGAFVAGSVLAIIVSVASAFVLPFVFRSPLPLLIVPFAIMAAVAFVRMRRTHLKSAVLLRQLSGLILNAINHPQASLAAKKGRVLAIETSFLNNDDELFTKKSIWEAFLQYKHDKGVLYGNGCPQGTCARCDAVTDRNPGNFVNLAQWRYERMYIPPVCAGDKSAVANPRAYLLNQYGHLTWMPHPRCLGEVNLIAKGNIDFTNMAENLPPTWLAENPLDLDNNDSDFVFLNWRIKRRIRDLFAAGSTQTYQVLREITEISTQSSVTFERMLRHKKISKKLKEFKNLANLRYLTPAAKMQLISFVDEVLQQRPYLKQCDSMIDLMAQKNVQIDRYTASFWKVHRRSMRFYVIEALWMMLTIPLFAAFIATWIYYGFLAGAGLFVLGGAGIAFGGMAMITRQVRDMKAKKLTPSLISSLIAIRHNMTSDSINDDQKTYEYEQAFKAAEKRFMLTVTEVEAVKLAKENVSDKVIGRLSPPMQRLRQNKEAQAHIYYEKFNQYRRACLRYGALELFIMLLAIPLVAAMFFGMAVAGFVIVELPLAIVGIAVSVALEALLIHNHLRVARRKELYLLIYQKMAVLLSNYKLFTNPLYIGAELHKLENSVIRAAEIDNLQDIAEHVSSVAVIDLGANQEQLANTYQNFQTKKDIGANSFDDAQFQGSLDALEADFQRLGASEPKSKKSLTRQGRF